MEQENMEQFDWDAATRSVPWDEQEERPIETEEIVKTWREQTPEGREFAAQYNTEANRKALLAALEIMGEISWPALTDTFARLRENKKLLRYQAPPTQAEVEQSNKAKWEADCLAWYNDPARATKQIRERAEKDPAFASWLKANRFEIMADDATALQAQARVLNAPESAGFHPDNLQWQRDSLREQAKRDEAYRRVPAELREFAAEYTKMTSRQVKARMSDPSFRKMVERASEHNLLI